MSSRMTRCSGLSTAFAVGVAVSLTAHQAMAESKVPVQLAVQTTVDASPTGIGPADAPVRSAVYTSADRKQVKVQPAHWFGPRYGYAPYYARYRAPYYYGYAPYAVPYYSAYAPPYTAYYAPAPYYAYPPVYTYRIAPRRAYYGAYYW